MPLTRRTSLLAAAVVPLSHDAAAGVLDWFTGVKLGAALPAFDAEYLAGEPRRERKLLLVDFWATWCAPCRAEFPHLNALHEAHAGRGLEVVGLTKESRAVVEAFLPKVDIRYKLGVGGNRPLQTGLGIKALPYAIVVNGANRIVWRGQASGLGAAEVERLLGAAA